MSFYSRIFHKKKKQQDTPSGQQHFVVQDAPTAEYGRLMQFMNCLNLLLQDDKYIARSDYLTLIEEYEDVKIFFQNQKTATTIENYCEKYGVPMKAIEDFLCEYEDLSNLKEGAENIQKHNQIYLQKHLESEKTYLDSILTKIDSGIFLDDEQRKVVLTDEDYMLVVAGAGAGKTTTVSAKVKFLVDKKGIKPEQIIVISFTNKAVDELRDRINKSLKIACPITTFHKIGYNILCKQNVDKMNVVDSDFMYGASK